MPSSQWPEKWKDKVWNVSDGVRKEPLTEAEVRKLFETMTRTNGEFGGSGLNGRKLDRALQLLRKAGLIEYVRARPESPLRWRVVPPPGAAE